ncbi:glycosyltransferase [Acinetobacter sp.]|uniref:glycosyltransferase n=1 Tax=Acinetobacter sp. TaxID=472 RepID=UPI00281C78A8|nr:glycosyltransferase [Acinetobacter sp.]MDR0234808.1 glycosyltransferase family 4 protein [Acinetobacter sp.]MDR2279138.1 glycosyltransferase family 4 protein [Vagococcus sp.]
MKMLYIGPRVEKISTGGDSVNKRNENLLKKIFDKNLNIYYIQNSTNTIFDKLKGYLGGITKYDIDEIIENISLNKIDCIFLSQSFYGLLCKKIKIKYPHIRIITFYHNIETHYAKEYIKTSGLIHFPFYFLATYNEKQTIKYSDYHIVLNERDDHLMKKIYGVESDFFLPVSYKDIFDSSKVKFSLDDPLKLLFVGSAFFGNMSGIEFFIEDVMPQLDVELIIVGKGMDKFKDKFEVYDNVKVFGFVDDLSALYYDASIVIAPIFSGGGMKTKIAEALMYGKTIIGTKEAFEGYKRAQNVIYECNNAEEFITCIKKLKNDDKLTPFNHFSRELYQKNYDDIVLEQKLKFFLQTIGSIS